MAHNSLSVANYFLDHAKQRGEGLTPMKLQKLVYYAHGWHLALKNEPLIDEQVEAWAYGPVIRSLYREFRRFGNKAITSKALRFRRVKDLDGRVLTESFTPIVSKEDPDGKFTVALLNKVWDVYGKYSAVQLSNKTHEDGTPWKQVFDLNGGELPKRTDIPSEIIKTYFFDLSQSGQNR